MVEGIHIELGKSWTFWNMEFCLCKMKVLLCSSSCVEKALHKGMQTYVLLFVIALEFAHQLLQNRAWAEAGNRC